MQEWKNIGQIFIENGILSQKSVARILNMSKRHNKRFGWTLEKLELVTEEELAAALAQQYGLKLASNLTRFSYEQDVLKLLSYEVALQNLIFPLKREQNNLLLAVADPTNLTIAHNLAANAGLQVVPCVATRSEIYAAVCKHYLDRTLQIPDRDTVLVVEDEAVSQATAKEFLTKADYNVLVENNGLEGFKRVISDRPHVILTDKVMPKFDGFSLLKSIQAIPELKSVPVILMSDKLSPADEMKVFDLGFFDYIPKPINRITLVSRIKRAFRFNQQKYDFF